MGNWTGRSGVYHHMRRLSLLLACSLSVMAQSLPQQDPLDAAIQAFWQSGANGGPQETAALREQTRTLLQSAPVDSPRFGSRAEQVAQLYQNAGLTHQARAILEESLGRTASLGYPSPSRPVILSAMGGFWEQDGNLLKAAGYLEQAAAAEAAAPPVAPSRDGAIFQSGIQVVAIRGSFPGGGRYFGSVFNTYNRLANLYQRLGRPEAVAATAEKIRALAANDPQALASFYEQREQFQQAAEIYSKIAEQSADPQAKANAWQSVAGVSARQEHYPDAIAAMQQAIAAVQSSDRPGVANQALWMRQNLAGYMRSAGQIEPADQVYQQILQESNNGPLESQFVAGYAQYLAESERGAQGEAFLKGYLENHPSLEKQQRINLFYSLANVARRANDSKTAEEYQQTAQALQMQPQPTVQILIGEELQKAQTALNERRWDDAYGLALHAIDSASQAADGQVDWSIPAIASTLATNKEVAKAEQLFQRLFALALDGSANSPQRLITVTQQHANFLMGQSDRWSEVPAAIDQFRRVLTDVNGPESGTLVRPLQMSLQFQITQSQWQQLDASVRALLELQQSLSGNTSDPYLRDLQTAANAYQVAGDFASALPLRRQATAIADLLATPSNSWERSQTRMAAAMTLAQMGQYDEAETLGAEAVKLAATQRNPGPMLAQQLDQIHRMKQSAKTTLPVAPVPMKP